jgi:TusA-related sulfurtransferase
MEVKCIDLRGHICPSTLLKALRELNSHKNVLKSQALTLVFLTDNRDSTVTIPQTAENMGYSSKIVEEQNYYRIEISAGNC